MSALQNKCKHLEAVTSLKMAKSYECEECVKNGDSWVHLRTCQECGITLCCDSSPNKHASKHASNYDHHVVISTEPGEKWMWCYSDNLFYEYK